MNCSVRGVTIRYSPSYNRSVFNPISIRFKANALKGLLYLGKERYSYKVSRLYRLSFRRLAQMGFTDSSVFKPIVYKVSKFFTEVCKRLPMVG